MSTSKSLPARPSLESLKKQAKKLARDVAAGDPTALARVRAHLPNAESLTQRNAQLVVAREYGFPGWQDLLAEVHNRLGSGLQWAASRARLAIHNNDLERLTQLLGEHPALLSWHGGDYERGVLGLATGAYGDCFEPQRERWYTRPEAAELLIDAGAVVVPDVPESLIRSRARGLLQLFRRRGLLPQTLKFAAALGDADAVRAALAEQGNDQVAVNEAFVCACRFHHADIASQLLDRAIGFDPQLGARIDGSVGRAAFVAFLIEHGSMSIERALDVGLWETFVIDHVRRAARDGNLAAFTGALRDDPWLLGDDYVWLQTELIANLTMNDFESLLVALLDLEPAVIHRRPPPPTQAFELALTYGHTHLLPYLTRIWTMPDDLAHAAGVGDLTRVQQWFDESGAPQLGDLRKHFPFTDTRAIGDLYWNPPTAQHVLDVALAFAVTNHHFEVADYLLAHGADINTNWNSHEPASIMHHLVFEDDYEAMQFTIDRGADLTIKDYRWDATAAGWARYAKNDEKMAQWLEDVAQRQ